MKSSIGQSSCEDDMSWEIRLEREEASPLSDELFHWTLESTSQWFNKRPFFLSGTLEGSLNDEELFIR
eukprot:CAMPEP_0116859976 /NCGR_PEP_ID=MMETSP0418-20121206/22143_1 /TAXON_ID=1158023 /ORGANISM="Astrosyne radiata, Strain 13vi08-1A" /LENGTH=67 /DNA_ID=CAMNT_0004494301 /DNA_START=1 /DNA_END=200 /DNA_ORIENTATION=+